MSDPNLPTPPIEPSFVDTGQYSKWQSDYSDLLGSIETELEKIKQDPHNHNYAGIALNMVIEKLMPYVQQYNMEYTQGNVANGQKAASYSLAVTNYVSSLYQESGPEQSGSSNPDPLAQLAINEMTQYNTFLSSTKSNSSAHGIADPFGSMGKQVYEQLQGVLGPNPGTASDVGSFWEQSWQNNLTPPDGSDTSNTGNNPSNSIIMQDINGAQNQAQSEAAYLQSESKLANQDYQQYASTAHDIAQNQINQEKAAVQSATSAGN
ncbi:MAG: hypothetical protein HRU43_04415 [Simkaniaceae bacterium]|nr:hypothetical protein [Simkaniaceae bacterium]